MIWMAIGLGFGQRDLAAARVGQIDAEGYDLRRGKTAVERYGDAPPLVWSYMTSCLQQYQRTDGEWMFITRNGLPIVHNRAVSVQQSWRGSDHKRRGPTARKEQIRFRRPGMFRIGYRRLRGLALASGLSLS